MGFPTNQAKRRNRRNLGRGQLPPQPIVTTSATGASSTAIVTFSGPVIVTGPLNIKVATLTYVSQVVNSPTQVTVTMSGTVATHAWTLDNATGTVGTYQGGTIAGSAGTF